MKRYIYSFLLLFSLLLFTGCEDITSEDPSKVTYFVTFDMSGDKLITIPVGQAYVEPGVKAMEGESDITSSMKTDGTVNSNVAGLYPITYTATNVDGFSSSISRNVIVYDPNITTDLTGEYTVGSGTQRIYTDGSVTDYSGYKIKISKVKPGIFLVSDYMGGFYDKLRALGSRYTAVGYIKLNADNTIEGLSGDVAAWGDSISSLDNAKYDPATKQIYWSCKYAGMTFNVYLAL